MVGGGGCEAVLFSSLPTPLSLRARSSKLRCSRLSHGLIIKTGCETILFRRRHGSTSIILCTVSRACANLVIVEKVQRSVVVSITKVA